MLAKPKPRFGCPGIVKGALGSISLSLDTITLRATFSSYYLTGYFCLSYYFARHNLQSMITLLIRSTYIVLYIYIIIDTLYVFFLFYIDRILKLFIKVQYILYKWLQLNSITHMYIITSEHLKLTAGSLLIKTSF